MITKLTDFFDTTFMKRVLLSTSFILGIVIMSYAQDTISSVDALTDDVWAFTTYKVVGELPVSAHGLIIDTDEGVVMVDAGWVPEQTQEVLDWIEHNLEKKVKACIITHGHDDRLGGAALIKATGAKIISTPEVAFEAAKHELLVPDPVLSADEMLDIGGTKIRTYYPGPGHTLDNIVVWLPEQKILFAGCFVKSCAANTLGYVTDAKVDQWPNSLNKVRDVLAADADYIIPGHDGWNCENPIEHTQRLILQHVIGE